MKRLIISTAAVAMMAGMAMAQDVVRLGTEGAYPPWNYINDAGEIDGFERELGDALCRRADLDCTWVKNDWDSIIPNLVSGNYDAIIAGMSITDERDEVIDFTQNYTPPDPSSYLGMTEGLDLDNAVIAAQTGTLQAGYVAGTGASLLEFASPEEAIAAVRNGEADAALADRSYLAPIAEDDPELMFVGEDVALGDGVGMGVRESDAELRETFDAAIQAMKDDGSLNALIEKWQVSSTF